MITRSLPDTVERWLFFSFFVGSVVGQIEAALYRLDTWQSEVIGLVVFVLTCATWLWWSSKKVNARIARARTSGW